MKKMNVKRVGLTMVMAMLLVSVLTMNVNAAAYAGATTVLAGSDFTQVVAPIVDLLNSLLTPVLLIVGAVGSLYCVLLGVKFAKAEEPQEREKAKSHLKNAIIGFMLIFVLMVVLKLLMPVMIDWVNANATTTL